MGLSVDSIIKTSVAYAIDLNVNTFFNFHIFRIENFQILQCEHIESSTDFPFQTQFWQFV